MDSALATLIARVVATNRSATITAPTFFVFILLYHLLIFIIYNRRGI